MDCKKCLWAFIHLLLVVCTRCSRVIDSTTSRGLHVSDYCPFMKGCGKPGIHVMCLKNPNVIDWFGPHCHEAKNITVTDQIALRLLTIVNAVRRKVALGIEKGLDGKLFPRGYGLWKLEWDSELATFAQVWANQCLFFRDYCHATSRFPRPSQSLGMVRFSYPDWRAISTAWPLPNGFHPKIIVHSVVQAVKRWYTSKNTVTPEDLMKLASGSTNKPYLNMISGQVTHMGCGISAFIEYSYNTEKVDLLYNSVLLVCNFSKRLDAGKQVYNVTPGPDSSKCGCPPGTKEDEDCLCTIAAAPPCRKGQCKPSVVILPIFTVEDPPLSKLANISSNIMNLFEKYENEVPKDENDIMNTRRMKDNLNAIEDRLHNNNTIEMIFDKEIGFSRNIDSDNIFGNYLKSKPRTQSKENIDLFEITNRDKASALGREHNSLHEDFTDIKDDLKDQTYTLTHDLEKNYVHFDNYNTSVSEYKANDYSVKPKDNADHKIINILDTLEKKVKEVGIGSSEKDMFDAKIRKIYNDIMMKTLPPNVDEIHLQNTFVKDSMSMNKSLLKDRYVNSKPDNEKMYRSSNNFDSNHHNFPHHSEDRFEKGNNYEDPSRNKYQTNGRQVLSGLRRIDRYEADDRSKSDGHFRGNNYDKLDHVHDIHNPDNDRISHHYNPNYEEYKEENRYHPEILHQHDHYDEDSDYLSQNYNEPEVHKQEMYNPIRDVPDRHHVFDTNSYDKVDVAPPEFVSGRGFYHDDERKEVYFHEPHGMRKTHRDYEEHYSKHDQYTSNRNSPFYEPRSLSNTRRMLEEKAYHDTISNDQIPRAVVQHSSETNYRRNFNNLRPKDSGQLDIDRRLYYQEKLDNLERRLQKQKTVHESNIPSLSPVRPTIQEISRPASIRATKDSAYLPLRVKTLHGY